MKVCFYYTVLSFYLVVCLKLKYNKKLFFDTKKVAKQKPKLRCKNCSAVTNNKVEKIIVLYYQVDNQFLRF